MDKLVQNFYKLLMGLSCVAMLAAFGTVMLGVLAREANWDIPGLGPGGWRHRCHRERH